MRELPWYPYLGSVRGFTCPSADPWTVAAKEVQGRRLETDAREGDAGNSERVKERVACVARLASKGYKYWLR